MAARDATTTSTAQGTAVASARGSAGQRSRTRPADPRQELEQRQGQERVQGEQIAWKLGLERRRADGRERERHVRHKDEFAPCQQKQAGENERAERNRELPRFPPAADRFADALRQDLEVRRHPAYEAARGEGRALGKPGINVREQIARIAHVEPDPGLCRVGVRGPLVLRRRLDRLDPAVPTRHDDGRDGERDDRAPRSLRSTWSTTQAASRAMPAVLAS